MAGRAGINVTAVLGGVTALVLFLSALGIFSLLSVSVSRRTREIGLRAALGANPRHVLVEILSRAMVLMGTGIAPAAALLLFLHGDLGRGRRAVCRMAWDHVRGDAHRGRDRLHRARQTRPQDQSNRRPAAGLSHSMTRNQGIRA